MKIIKGIASLSLNNVRALHTESIKWEMRRLSRKYRKSQSRCPIIKNKMTNEWAILQLKTECQNA